MRLACALFMAFTIPVSAAEVTFTGVVSDVMCKADHGEADPAACIRECVEESTQYALVVQGKVYMLVAEDEIKELLDGFAGRTATISGDRRNDIIAVTSVQPAK